MVSIECLQIPSSCSTKYSASCFYLEISKDQAATTSKNKPHHVPGRFFFRYKIRYI